LTGGGAARPTAAIAAAVAQRPAIGGHTWFALQYLLGFRALGWDVVLVDRLDEATCVDERGRPCALERSAGAAYLAGVMSEAGLGDGWALLGPGDQQLGIDRAELDARLDRSALLLNVMGYLDDPELRDRAELRVFLDIDPGFGQMWRELGLHDLFAGHDRFVTVGLNVGRPGCLVPDCGLEWIATLPPVALSHWPFAEGGEAFTSVASWRGPFGPIEYGGRTLGLRVHEFRRFADLPAGVSARFEIALDIDRADAADRERLERAGWILADPRVAAGSPGAYRGFIQHSGAELNVAKNMYVDTHSGWFSDRSACYLASGKPVLAQDTGFGSALPVGDGLLSFANPEDAAAGVQEVMRDRPRHAHAARALAEEHFDSSRVLGRLLDALGVGS
jgi:hypothetical protein